jgi:hypothetical protein
MQEKRRDNSENLSEGEGEGEDSIEVSENML